MATPLPARPLRRDAERNRDRVVGAAREVFAELGLDAPLEEVARRAGVGIGTVYRRFATKEDLIDAVFEDVLGELVEIAEQALELEDPWDGFSTYLRRVMEQNAANRGLKGVLGARTEGHARLDAVRARMRPLVGRLIRRAQEQGTLRADFVAADLPLLFAAAGRVMETTRDSAPELWRRFLGLLLDGLRAEGATPLPQPSHRRGRSR